MILDANHPGLLFVLVGPGGAGKNTLMNAAMAALPSLRQLATATTRPPRPEEQHGQQHLFISTETLRAMLNNHELIEWQEVTVDRYYGVPRPPVDAAIQAGQDLIADIDVFGAISLRLLYPEHVVLVFVQPPSMEILETRLRDRNDESASVIAARIERAKMEMRYLPTCDYVITNDNVHIAEQTLQTIIRTEQTRRSLHLEGITNQLPRQRFEHQVAVLVRHGGDGLKSVHNGLLPTVPLQPEELPYQGALRLLTELLPQAPNREYLLNGLRMRGSFAPPVTLTREDHRFSRQITYQYVYDLPELLSPPDGWTWTILEDLNLLPEMLTITQTVQETV